MFLLVRRQAVLRSPFLKPEVEWLSFLSTQSILLLRGPVGISFWDIMGGEEFGVSSLANSILDGFIELFSGEK